MGTMHIPISRAFIPPWSLALSEETLDDKTRDRKLSNQTLLPTDDLKRDNQNQLMPNSRNPSFQKLNQTQNRFKAIKIFKQMQLFVTNVECIK